MKAQFVYETLNFDLPEIPENILKSPTRESCLINPKYFWKINKWVRDLFNFNEDTEKDINIQKNPYYNKYLDFPFNLRSNLKNQGYKD